MVSSKRILSVAVSIILVSTVFLSADVILRDQSLLFMSAGAAVITVDDTGGRDHQNIQDAIDAANTGDTVYVYAGTYHEDLLITGKSINLTGEDPDTTMINSDIFSTGIRVESNQNNISGFTVTDGYWGIELNSSDGTDIFNCKCISNWDSGIVIDRSHNVTVRSCLCENNDLDMFGDYVSGLIIGRSTNNTVSGSTFSFNDVGIALLWHSHDNTLSSNDITSNDYNGLALKGGDRTTLLGNQIRNNNVAGGGSNYPAFWIETDLNTISKNVIDGNSATGVYMKNASGNQLYYNNITWNVAGMTLVEDSSGNDILGNTIQFNDENGIAIHTGCGGNDVRENSLSNNNFLSVTDYPAIFVNSDGNQISRNELDGNDATGLYMRECSNNTVDNNTVHSAIYGIYLYDTELNRIENNSAYFNSRNGIFVLESDNNTMFNNTCSGNPEHGIYLSYSSDNLVLGNDVSRNSPDTVWDFVGLTSFEGSTDEGWVHRGRGDCWERGNPAGTPSSVHDGNNVWGTDLDGNYGNNADFALYAPSRQVEEGGYVEFWHYHELEDGWDLAYLEVSDDGGLSWSELTRFTGDSGGWIQEIVLLDGYYGEVELRFRVKSDGNLGKAGWYIDYLSYLTMGVQDFEAGSDDGWTHAGNGDTWEHGVPLSGPMETPDGTQVWGTNLAGDYENNSDCSLYSPQFTLESGTSLSFFSWMELESGFDDAFLEITDNGGMSWDTLRTYTESSNGWQRESVSLSGYQGNVRIRFRLDTDASEARAGWYVDSITFTGGGGIHVEDGSRNVLSGNECNNTGSSGIFLQDSDHNVITFNHCSGNRENGVTISSSDLNSLGNNTCRENVLNGIYAEDSHWNALNGTVANGNTLCGINLSGSNNNTLAFNNVSLNRMGIELRSSCHDTRILDNTILENYVHGTAIRDSGRNVVSFNMAAWNGENGMTFRASDQNNIDNNTLFQNLNGITLSDSDYNDVLDNTIMNNWNYGLLLDPSFDNVIDGNNITYNWNNGITLFDSQYNIISMNNCSDNLDGIHLDNSDSNLILDNVVLDNWDDGISLVFSWSCSISRNTCSGNWWYGIYLFDLSAFTIVDNNTCSGNELGIMLEDNCGGNLVENNTVVENVYGIYLYESQFNEIIYNSLISNYGFGVVINGASSQGNVLHHNSFLFNYDSSFQAYDAAIDNEWNDTAGEGNFWENYTSLYPLATSDGNVWDTPYDITGAAGAADNFPLFYAGPGADDELPSVVSDDTPAFATTGDIFTFSAEFDDNLGLVLVNLLYSYDGLTYENVSMNRVRGDAWQYTITVEDDATEMSYMYYLRDMGRNQVLTDEVIIPVRDNDAPNIVDIDTPDEATTGDTFTFTATLNDNIGISSVSVEYSHATEYETLPLLLTGNSWSGTINIADDAVVLYYFFRYSDGTNENETSEFTLAVHDNDAPKLVSDITGGGTTGDMLVFEFELTDNIEMDEAWVNYTENGVEWDTVDIEEGDDDTWSVSVVLGDNSTFFDYYVTAVDMIGNELVTDNRTLPVADNDPPVAVTPGDMVVDQDEQSVLDGTGCTDNVGIDIFLWSFEYDGELKRLIGESTEFVFGIAGTFTVTLKVTDIGGNSAEAAFNVTVLDRTPPRADAGPDMTVDQNERVDLDANDSDDNIGIVDFTWSFEYDGESVTLSGDRASYVFEKAGEYEIVLNVTDEAGNWALDPLTVTVKDVTRPTAVAGPDIEIEERDYVYLNGSGSSDDVGVESYIWSFHYDGSEQTLKGASQNFNFKITGKYTVVLTVTDAQGNIGQDELVVTVRETGTSSDDDTTDDDTGDDDDRPPRGTGGDDQSEKSWLEENMLLLIIGLGIILAVFAILFLIIIRRRKKTDDDILEDAEFEQEEIDPEPTMAVDELGDEAAEGGDIRKEMGKLRETMDGCSEAGMDMDGYEERYREMEASMDLGNADGLAVEAQGLVAELDSAYYEHFDGLKDRAKEMHRKLNVGFKDAMRDGIDVKDFKGDYEEGIKCFKERDFGSAIGWFERVRDSMDAVRGKSAGGGENIVDGVAEEESLYAATVEEIPLETVEAFGAVEAALAVEAVEAAGAEQAEDDGQEYADDFDELLLPAERTETRNKKVDLDSLFARILPPVGVPKKKLVDEEEANVEEEKVGGAEVGEA